MNDLLFLGDFYYDYDSIQNDIIELGEYIGKNDYEVILNLEGAYKGENKLAKWTVMSHTKRVLDTLEVLNVKAVSLANNHMLDWGEEGLKKIIRDLEKANIPYFGAGLDIESAFKPYIIEKENLKIGFLGYCWGFYQGVYLNQKIGGIALLEDERIFSQIEKLKEEVDKLIMVVHWGYEYEKYPLPIHRKLAHKCIKKGVDIIIGHHPHIIQVKEIYREKPIYYSLGNFYFGSRREDFVDVSQDKTGTSKYGLGVVWNPKTEKTTEMFMESNPERTKLKDYFEMGDISEIPLENYNEFFKRNKKLDRGKPSLYIEKQITNSFKLKLYNFKMKCRRSLFYVLHKLNLFNSFKKWVSEYLV